MPNTTQNFSTSSAATVAATQAQPAQQAGLQTVSTPESDNINVIHEASGTHLLLSLKDCAADILNDETKLRELTRLAAEATGATVLEICSHKFAPQGVTSLVMLAESHASLHTYPESNMAFWDCFTCGTTCNPELSVAVLVDALKPGSVSKQLIARN